MGIFRFQYRAEAAGMQLGIPVTYRTGSCLCLPDASRAAAIEPGGPARTPYRPGMQFQTVYLLHGGGAFARRTGTL